MEILLPSLPKFSMRSRISEIELIFIILLAVSLASAPVEDRLLAPELIYEAS